MINEPATPDPITAPSEPATAAYPAHDPWSAMPPSDTPPATAEFSAPPAPHPAPTAPFSAPPAAPSTAHVPAPPAGHEEPTARFSAPPAPHPAPTAQFPAPHPAGPTAPYAMPPAGPVAHVPPQSPPTAHLPVAYSAPPATAQFSAPPAHFSAPPAPFPVPGQFSAPPARPGPHPPVPAPALLPAGYPPARPDVVAVQIGEIVVTPPVIRTPAGVLPLAGASWQVTDFWQKEEKIATWALVCAIVGFFCLTFFSLLFLLIKETRHHGTVQVTVVNGMHQYVARIPVLDQGQVQHINNQVNYARSLSTL
ncbi:hypothetical protein FHX75_13401 [Micromonospora palomenae]|uniref:Uncharacterized protein n=1 Tax=Micromonospora palomenae TaxID=1461247 RepID=A0A561VP17_9ACTN|nr:hypothetical protein [Micromonospora palomenae]TWG13363.1 hypothetical protein FHX75_13401 [Micromonospora palomenae]